MESRPPGQVSLRSIHPPDGKTQLHSVADAQAVSFRGLARTGLTDLCAMWTSGNLTREALRTPSSRSRIDRRRGLACARRSARPMQVSWLRFAASVAPTDAPERLLLARFGHIDRYAIYRRNARHSDRRVPAAGGFIDRPAVRWPRGSAHGSPRLPIWRQSPVTSIHPGRLVCTGQDPTSASQS